ncbi:MAG: carboxypeptidase regulatory-like domain-containing protein [Reichenbachiella sp.]|uniref:TonB-dependent receptor n=1 Tax=Reichenbachiella sp. TaxID=2184521 RepID=UPI0032679605
MKQKILLSSVLMVVSLLFGSMMSMAQGVTTSGMNGKVVDNTGAELPGATIIAIHVPTGSKYGNITDLNGFYRIPNMKVGGPYTVTVSFVGFENYVQNGVYLTLGQTFKLDATLSSGATELEEVVVTAGDGKVFDGNRTGASTYIGSDMISKMPAASRSIRDFARLTPQAQITEGDDGFSISIAGQNNRYNAIYIDGAVNNDVFGLAGSGTNGGQTGVNPFSVDAIEQFQVAVAPFDVRISGFSGGAISAITRSGSNEVEGSAYYFVRNESLAGKTPKDLRVNDEREKLAEFSAKTYGLRIGGPIIKDKAFFFVNYERQDDEIPQPFNISNYTGNSNASDLASLRTFVNNQYNYDIGDYANTTRTLVSDKITAKFDFNLGDDHKLVLKHSYVGAENLEARNSGNRNVGFLNGSEEFITTTNSSTIELSSSLGTNFANKLILGYTSVRDDRDPKGDPFPSVYIADGLSTSSGDGEGLTFGAEPFSTANLLNQDVFTLTNNFDIFKGNHTITVGMHHEYSKTKNLFQAFNYGQYEYLTVADFIADANPNIYQRGYSLISGAVGDESDGAAEFSMYQLGLYVQDEYNVTNDLKLTAGIRVDLPFWAESDANNDFNTRTIPLLEAAGKDLEGAEVGKKVKTKPHFSPRFGFNWNVNGESDLQVRGGIGVFTSRVPLVWPGGTYNNNGVNNGFLFLGSWFATTPTFERNVNNQSVGAAPGSGANEGNIDLFAPDFKLPSVMKINIALDKKLPIWGLLGSVEVMYNKNINAIYYQNLNIGDPVGTLTGADNRARYSRTSIDGSYGRIMFASNTSEGYSWNTAFTVTKPTENGFSGSFSYSYGDSRTTFEGTSSQNSSQWRNHQTVNGKNGNIPTTRSDFSQGHRFQMNMSYTKNWTDNLKTTVGVYYEVNQDVPLTYVYREGSDLLGDDSRDNALIFVPASRSQINLVDANGLTADQQWTALNNFIENNDYLSQRRGRYVERNGDRGPWQHTLDLKFIQEIALDKNRLQFSLDIFNFANLINKDWGQRKFNNFGEVALIETQGVTDNGDGTFTPSFSFDPTLFENGIETVDDSGIQSSRWQMQLGIRYIFGK